MANIYITFENLSIFSLEILPFNVASLYTKKHVHYVADFDELVCLIVLISAKNTIYKVNMNMAASWFESISTPNFLSKDS